MGKLHILNVLWILVVVMSHTRSEKMLPKANSYFFDAEESGNSSAVTWAHAVNSIQLLTEALHDDAIMMLEADVLMGTLEGSSEIIPIMSHPPKKTSDLSFQDFVNRVLHHVSHSKVKKGIKLDFKSIEALEPSLKILQNLTEKIVFPVWLNADVLKGPVNATTTPVDAEQFLNLTQTYFPNATLSLGWTTKYGCDTKGRYELSHIQEMIKLLDDLKEKNMNFGPTFPVRAGLTAETKGDDILLLLASFPGSTLTLWGSADDPVDMTKLRSLIDEVGLTRMYIDVPFDLETGPGEVCGNGTVVPAPSSDNNIPGCSSLPSKNMLLTLFLTFITAFIIRRYF